MSGTFQLGELQLAIMRVLWRHGEATVAGVHEELQADRARALTTIATMLTKMEKKGIVRHRLDGRQFVYEPTISEAQVKHSMVAQLTDRLFEGDVKALVTHLIDEQDIEADELAVLKKMIARREARDRRN